MTFNIEKNTRSLVSVLGIFLALFVVSCEDDDHAHAEEHIRRHDARQHPSAVRQHDPSRVCASRAHRRHDGGRATARGHCPGKRCIGVPACSACRQSGTAARQCGQVAPQLPPAHVRGLARAGRRGRRHRSQSRRAF